MVTITETAARKVVDLRLEEGKPEWGLRIRVVGGGCSGFSYELGWEDQTAEGDSVIASQGVKVFNPAFDVTPHAFVTALITDRGVVPATHDGVARALELDA